MRVPRLDRWAGLSHKDAMTSLGPADSPTRIAPTWVGDEHEARLGAYRILAAYLLNSSRFFLPDDTDEKERMTRREYGDAALLVATIRAAVVGDEFGIRVPGAGEAEPPEPETLSDVPPDDPAAREEWNARRQALDTERTERTERIGELERLNDRQEWWDKWATEERLNAKVLHAHDKSLGLGDAVYVSGWSGEHGRVRIRAYDPGAYFPDLGDDDEDFPSRIDLAWEIDRRTGTNGTKETWIRRITFELRDLEATVLPDGEVPPFGATEQADGRFSRRYPYQDANERPSTKACYVTKGRWRLDSVTDPKRNGAGRMLDVNEDWPDGEYDVDESGAEMRRLDLGIDFIPVVHLPAGIAEEEHYGESVLLRVAQILDDLISADSDMQAASVTTGSPTIVVNGTRPDGDDIVTYKGGQMRFVGEKGGMDVLDTSAGLAALEGYVRFLLWRLSTVRQVPGEVLGTSDPAKLSSGFHMMLTFGPLRTLVRDLRLVCDEKYPLLCKMVQRIALVAGADYTDAERPELALGPNDEVLPAEMEFGTFIPSDLGELVTTVSILVKAHIISRATGLRILVAAGLPGDIDLDDETDAARHEDFEGAVILADAIGEDAAADFLGREPPPPVAPEPLPPAPAAVLAPPNGIPAPTLAPAPRAPLPPRV